MNRRDKLLCFYINVVPELSVFEFLFSFFFFSFRQRGLYCIQYTNFCYRLGWWWPFLLSSLSIPIAPSPTLYRCFHFSLPIIIGFIWVMIFWWQQIPFLYVKPCHFDSIACRPFRSVLRQIKGWWGVILERAVLY